MIAMDVNMKTSLFKIQLEEVELVNNDKVDDINMDHLIESVMQDSITRVAKITTSNKNSSVSILEGMARKIYTCDMKTHRFHEI